VRRGHQAGFTLIEMMTVVALIGVLAAIAVPSFFGESRKAKGDAEVGPMFQDLRTRLEQYQQENGLFVSTGVDESDTWPVLPSAQQQPLNPLPGTWVTLKVRTSNDNARCAYVAIAGLGGDDTNLGPKAAEFGFAAAPATNWYYLLAHCDLDGDAAADSYYFSSSVDPTIKKQNPGR
jgi:prepilin-type N-terminal cleavage/methylation domain-containing protein